MTQGYVGLAVLEGDERGVVAHPDFHDDADCAAEQRADCHGGKDYAGGDLEAEGDGGEEETEDRGEH